MRLGRAVSVKYEHDHDMREYVYDFASHPGCPPCLILPGIGTGLPMMDGLMDGFIIA